MPRMTGPAPMPSKLERSRRRKLIAFMLVVLLLAVVAVCSPWILEKCHREQARAFSSEASRLMEERDFAGAVPLLVKALQKSPQDADVLRHAARACDALANGAHEAVTFWRRLCEGGSATWDDRISLAAALIRAADVPNARRVLAEIPAAERGSLRYVELQAKLMENEGREKDALMALREAWRSHPDDPACQLKLAQLDMNSPFGPIRQKAVDVLWDLARNNPQLAASSLRAIASASQLSLADVKNIREVLAKDEHIDARDRLAILGACLRKFPHLASEFVAAESPRVAGRDPEDCVEFYEWLARLGDADRILHDLAVPGSASPKLKPVVMKSRDLFLAFGDALIARSKWQEFSDMLQSGNLPVSTTDAELMRSMCAKQLQGGGEVDSHLGAALSAAKLTHDPVQMERVVDAAERLERPALAVEACKALLNENPASRVSVLKRVFRLQQNVRDGNGMLETADELVSAAPALTMFADLSIYLRLLTGRDLEAAMQQVRSTAQNDPVSDLRRLSMALAALQSGDLKQAALILPRIEMAKLPAGARAVYAALTVKAGAGNADFAEIAKMQKALLLDEEQWFLDAALRRGPGHFAAP